MKAYTYSGANVLRWYTSKGKATNSYEADAWGWWELYVQYSVGLWWWSHTWSFTVTGPSWWRYWYTRQPSQRAAMAWAYNKLKNFNVPITGQGPT